MIAVDTSALVAIFLREPRAAAVLDVLLSNPRSQVPVFCVTEFALVRRLGPLRLLWLEELFEQADLVTADLTASMAPVAADAAMRYGKGSGHPARLNFGGCMSYAFARTRNLPLLFVGADFAHTDVVPAL